MDISYRRSCTRGWLSLATLAALMSIAGVCRASIVIGSHDWDMGSHGWTNQRPGFTSLDLQRIPTNGNPNGWLQMTFPADGSPDAAYDVVYTSATNLFAGTWTTNMWVEFDFWAATAAPEELEVRWQSSTNSYVWSYQLSPGGTQEWETFRAGFLSRDDWADPFGPSVEQYLADLSTIDWIGIYIFRGGADDQLYGLDDFQVMIPEPAECVMLIAVLAVAGLSLRDRRRRIAAGMPDGQISGS